MQVDQAQWWRRAQVAAAVIFAGAALAALIVPAWWLVAILVLSALLFARATSRLATGRIDRAYRLMARIGAGEFAATDDPIDDEPGLRLHRGVARIQRGFSEALAHAEAERDEVRSLLGSVDTGLLSLDEHLRVRSANSVAERLLGLTPGSYRGRFLAEAIREPEFLSFMETSLTSSGALSREIAMGSGGGDTLLVAADPIRAASGQVTGVLVALDDMTRLRRLEQLRTDFAANVSHELRTPITNIKGYLDTLLEVGYDDPAQVSNFLEIAQRNANRLCTLVEDILLLAFLERPGAERQVSLRELPVADVVNDAVEQLASAAAAKSMPIKVQVDAELRFGVDAALATQAILNLISNAIKYAPASTPITIDAALADGIVRIRVGDEGPGIDPIHIPRLFERFYRVESARSRELGGTGLGLSIVKHIAILHGGGVEVSCPEGGGTLFTVCFPRGSRVANHS